MNRLETLSGGPYGIVCAFVGSTQNLEQTSRQIQRLTREEGYPTLGLLIRSSQKTLAKFGISKTWIRKELPLKAIEKWEIKQISNRLEKELLLQNSGYLSSQESAKDWSQIVTEMEQIEVRKAEVLINFFKEIAPQREAFSEPLQVLETDPIDLDPRLRSTQILQKAENIRKWMKENPETLRGRFDFSKIGAYPKEISLFTSLSIDQTAHCLKRSASNGHLDTLISLKNSPFWDQIDELEVGVAFGFAGMNGHLPCLDFLFDHLHSRFMFLSRLQTCSMIVTLGHAHCLLFVQKIMKFEHGWAHYFILAAKHGHLNCLKIILKLKKTDFFWDSAIYAAADQNQAACLEFLLKNCPHPLQEDFLTTLSRMVEGTENHRHVALLASQAAQKRSETRRSQILHTASQIGFLALSVLGIYYSMPE